MNINDAGGPQSVESRLHRLELLATKNNVASNELLISINHTLAAEITRLTEQIQGMKADAERYRWLRHGDNDELVIQHGPVAPDYHWLPRKERLDVMIDQAMQDKGE